MLKSLRAPIHSSKVVMSFGIFSSYQPVETVAFGNLSSAATVRLAPAKLRGVRTVTIFAASKPATETKKREPRGIMKPLRVSPEMQAFLGGVSEIPRNQALQEIWAHIKQHNLLDPEDKKVIICDEKLKKIFGGRDRVWFLETAGLINPHFLK